MEPNSLTGLRCMGLTRSSSSQQTGEGQSNDQQLAILQQYANAHGMIWVGEERAEGVSGSQTDNRQDIENLLYRARTAKDYDVLLVQSYDRLTRGGAAHGGYLLYSFDQANVRIVSVCNDIPDNEYSAVLQCLEFTRGQGTAIAISQATLRGRASHLFDGNHPYCQRTPYGLDRLILSSSGDKLFRIRTLPNGWQHKLHTDNDDIIEKYAPNPKKGTPRHFKKHVDQKVVFIPGVCEAVEAVKFMYDSFYVKTTGAYSIAVEFNRREMLSPTGGKWSTSTIYQILMNPIYIGKGVANRMTNGMYHSMPDQKGQAPQRVKNPKKLKKLKPVKSWTIFHHPEIDFIQSDLHDFIWKRQHEMLARKVELHEKRKRLMPPARSNSPHLLLGSIFEKTAKVALKAKSSGRTGTNRYYFNLDSVSKPSGDSHGMSKLFPAMPLERAVLDSISDVFSDVGQITPELYRYAVKRLDAVQVDVPIYNELVAKRDELRSKKVFVLEEYQDVGDAKIRQIIAPLTVQIRDLDTRIEMIERSRKSDWHNADEVVNSILTQINQITQNYTVGGSALNSVIRACSRTIVDLPSRTAEIEVRLPNEVFQRKGNIERMCEVSTFRTENGQIAHHDSALILAKFHCVLVRKFGRASLLKRMRLDDGQDFAQAA